MKNFYKLYYLLCTSILFSVAVRAQSFSNTESIVNTAVYQRSSLTAPATINQNDLQVIAQDERIGEDSGDPNGVLSPMAAANDNCSAGINPPFVLTPNSSCTAGTLGPAGSPATTEVGETFACMSPAPTRTVWFSFMATQTDMWVSIKPTGAIVCSQNFGLAVYQYSGVCPPSGAIGCVNYTAYSAQRVYNILNLTGLTVGATYLIQVGQNPGCTRYTFCIAVGTTSNCNTCSNPCGPMCQYIGAPTPAQVTATCPGYPLAPPMNEFDTRTSCYTFTAPYPSITIQQIIWSYCNPNTYSFTYSLYDNSCGVIASNVNVFANNVITGLVPGQVYRICYSLQAACTWDSLVYPYLYSNSPLPMELISFTAKSFGKNVFVSWKTASEKNCQWYVVEKTTNGRDFTQVEKIKAAGTSTSLNEYAVSDRYPHEGLSYYRLREIDYDGTEHLSKLVAVRYSPLEASLQIIPNPANKGMINIGFHAPAYSLYSIRITNLDGKVVFWDSNNSNKEEFNAVTIDISYLKQGIYFTQLILADQVLSEKLVIQ